MIHKVKGIVFRFTRFRETSIIVTVFTDEFGLQSYMVNGVRSKSTRSRIALYQPLTLLDMVVYHRSNANIERIKEIRCLHPYRSITTDVKKSSIALFITELLNKTVKEESHTKDLFAFLLRSMVTLDELDEGYENFHLIFMLRLSSFLGFGVANMNEVIGGRIADERTEELLKQILTAEYTDKINLTNKDRRNLLDMLIHFFADHTENLSQLKSLQVLKEVLA